MNFNSKIAQQLIFLILFPLLNLYISFQSRSERLTTLGGTLFMGLVGSIYIYIPGTDGVTHLHNVYQHYIDMTFPDFFQKSIDILTLQATTGSSDMYIHSLSFLAGSIFGVPELLHVFAGLVLGFFFTKSVLLVLKHRTVQKKDALLIAFIALFLIVRSITALNSIRMWTGMWVFFFGSYGWIVTKEKKYLWITLLSSFVHFSYLIIAIPVVTAFIIKGRKLLVIAIFGLSFIFTINFFSIESYIPDLPLLETKQKIYVELEDDGSVVRTPETQNFYKKYGTPIYMDYGIVGVILLMLLVYFRTGVDDRLLFLISSGMLLYATANVVEFSPSFSGRSKQVSSIFITASVIYTLLNKHWFEPRNWRKFIYRFGLWLFILSSIPFLLFHISYIISTVSVFIFALPILSWLLGEGDLSIRQAIGDIW